MKKIIFPAPQVSCQPCLTVRLFFSILRKHIKLFWSNFKAELHSHNKINEAACYISRQESSDPEQREKFYEELQKIRKKHGLAPDHYTGLVIRVKNSNNKMGL